MFPRGTCSVSETVAHMFLLVAPLLLSCIAFKASRTSLFLISSQLFLACAPAVCLVLANVPWRFFSTFQSNLDLLLSFSCRPVLLMLHSMHHPHLLFPALSIHSSLQSLPLLPDPAGLDLLGQRLLLLLTWKAQHHQPHLLLMTWQAKGCFLLLVLLWSLCYHFFITEWNLGANIHEASWIEQKTFAANIVSHKFHPCLI